jgi:hypothetical protein
MPSQSDSFSGFIHTLHQLKTALFNLAIFIIFVVGLYVFVKHEVELLLYQGNHSISRPADLSAGSHARSP